MKKAMKKLTYLLAAAAVIRQLVTAETMVTP